MNRLLRIFAILLPLAAISALPLQADARATAKKIESPSELILGIKSEGRVGDFLIANEKAAFIIEDVRPSSGYHPYGGIIADAGRPNADGRMAHNLMGEIVPVISGGGHSKLYIRSFKPEKIEIVRDGSDGGPALIRVEGKDGSFVYVDEAMPGKTRSILAGMTYEYELGPDATYVEQRLTVTNNSSSGDHDYQLGGAYFIGDGINFFLPDKGYDTKRLQDEPNKFIALTGPQISYGLRSDDNPPQMLFNYGDGKIIIGLGPEFHVKMGESRTLTTYISVGAGDAASIEAPFLNTNETAALEGTVSISQSGPEYAEIYAFAPGAGQPRSIIRTGPDGKYSAALPAGDYELAVTATDHPVGERQAVALKAGKSANWSPVLPPTGLIDYSVQDETGQHIPCTIAFDALAQTAIDPVAAPNNRYGTGFEKIHFSLTGEGTIALLPGRYRVWVSRGLEYEIDKQELEVKAGETVKLQSTIAHSVDTTGFMSGDFHLHSLTSPDSNDIYEEKVASLVAAQLEVPVATDHDSISDYQPIIDKMGVGKWIVSIIGEELTTLKLGHFNGFPLTQYPDKPNLGAVDWLGLTGPQIFQSFRDFPGEQVVQLNHPRSGLGGYLDAVQFDPKTGAVRRMNEFSLDFDSLELFNGKGGGELIKTLPDWYALLNMGRRVSGCGNSDSHQSYNLQAGYPRNMVKTPTDDPRELDIHEYAENVKRQRLTVNGGHFISVWLNGAADTLGETFHAADGAYSLRIRVQSPTWIDLKKVELVENGETIKTFDVAPSDKVVKFDETIDLKPARDAWYVVQTYGDNDLSPAYPGATPRSFTNPFWIDADGDGKYEPVMKVDYGDMK